MNSLVKAGEGTPKSEKKVRKILPKRIEKCQNNDGVDVATPPSSTNTEMQIAITPPATVKNASNGQYMIPVTLMTPCKKCKKMISASNVQDLQHHVCPAKFKNVECTVKNCDKKFFTQLTLRYHLKHYHRIGVKEVAKKSKPVIENANGVNKKFSCDNCGKKYKTKSYLEEHKRSAHTGERPFSCDNCSKGFTRILDLKKHQLLKVCHLISK